MPRQNILTIIIFFALTCSLPGATRNVKIFDEFYTFEISGKPCRIPCAGAKSIRKSRKISHILLVFHGVAYDADKYWNRGNRLLKDLAMEEHAIAIAPQLLKNSVLKNPPTDLISWERTPFWGSSKALRGKQKFRLSAYTIIDQLLTQLINKETFPNLSKITLIGHSAGGQLVNRYAVSSKVSTDLELKYPTIQFKYIVMNPSSYVYLDKTRPVDGQINVFKTPNNTSIKNAPKYNDYGHGLNALYAYHRKNTTKESMIAAFENKTVIYLLGEKDNYDNGNLDTSKESMLQGPNRLWRGKAYYNHLINFYGPQVKEKQKLFIVPNIAHSSSKMMRSDICKKIVF